MFRENFAQNFSTIEKLLIDSELFKTIKNAKFEQQIEAQVLTELFKTAIGSAISLEELALKNAESKMGLEKARAEMETTLKSFLSDNSYKQAEALKSVVQAKIMIRSAHDNANINKANAYTQVISVLGNATNVAHSNWGEIFPRLTEAIASISESGAPDGKLADFDETIKAMRDDILSTSKQSDMKLVFIHAPKLELTLNEAVELRGISAFDSSRFKLDGVVVADGCKDYLFKSASEGSFKLTFESGENFTKSDSVTIVVKKGQVDTEIKALQKF